MQAGTTNNSNTQPSTTFYAINIFLFPYQIPECDLPHLLPPYPTVMVASGGGELVPELLAE